MKILMSYLKQHFILIISILIAVAIFAGVFSLYALPMEAIWYALTLTIFVFVILGLIQYTIFYKKHKVLEKLEKSINISISTLPLPNGQIERDYQALLHLLYQEKSDAILEKDRTLSDMNDYYTLWAHQIKTPIAAMRLLLQTNENPELSQQLFKIEQYVDMVLGYLRSESMSGDLEIKKYSLDEIIKQAVKKHSKTFFYKKISLDYEPLHCAVLTDEKWLLFAIEQIISNALKYTNEGKISIYMVEPNVLAIEDTGIGIRAEDLPRVCERGFTGYNGREDKKSTGIGLYLCKRILTKLSHTIEIESEVGKFTKVKIGFENLTKM